MGKAEQLVNNKRYKYFAFISYKSDDLKEAWRLKKKLDNYKLPTVLSKQYEKPRRPTHEAFLDKTNIQPGDLTQELKDNLDNSHYLIVVCSPRSAKSEYVAAEIKHFTRNGREEEMFLFIIESDPQQIEASFNPAIKASEKLWAERDGEKHEILGVNIHEKDIDKMFLFYRCPIIGAWLQRERAYMQLISKLLNLDFAQLWSYQKIRLTEIIVAWATGVILISSALFYTWYINQPVDIAVQLDERAVYNSNLPPLKDAIVTIMFDNKTETDTIHSISSNTVFTNVPHRFLNKEVRMTVKCPNYMDVDTALVLKKNIILSITRNPSVFGNIHFRLWDYHTEQGVANIKVKIAGHEAISDNNGCVNLFIPLESQRQSYYIEASIPLENDTVSPPCGKDDVITVR